MAMDFSWLPQGTDVNRLPLGMRVNNPGNIKYNPKLGYSGMLGPSSHTDQGDPQMTFDTPQSGMTAAARLAATKYRRGQRTPMSIIAGQGGWTPGNRAAAANIAKTMGIGPDDDLSLDTPERMAKFLRALTLQEHGPDSKLYGDDIYSKAAGVSDMPAKPSYLAQALNMAGMVPGAAGPAGVLPAAMAAGGAGAGPGGAPIGGAPIAGGPQPLTAPNMRYSKLADALLASAAGAKPKGWGDLLNAAGDLALGYTMGNRADEEQKTYKSKLAEALLGASDNDAMAKTLMATGDDDLVKQGVALKVAQSKPQNQVGRFRPSKQGVIDTVTGKIVPGTEASGEADAEYGTAPQYYRDKDGNLRIGQLSKAGGMKSVDLPEGATVLPGIDKVDTGTEFQFRDKRTGDVIGSQPKDITGKEAAEERGKLGGQAQVALPAAKTMVDNAFATINKLRTHPGLETGTGASNVFDPRSWIPGTDSYNFQSMNKQAQGQSFMAARDALKGAGQVTDFEGAKGEQAIANLDAAQSKEQYLAALDTLEKMMQASYGDLQRKAGMAGGGAPAAAPPGGERTRIDLGGGAGGRGPARIQSQQEYQALPPGTQYIAPDGSIRTKQ